MAVIREMTKRSGPWPRLFAWLPLASALATLACQTAPYCESGGACGGDLLAGGSDFVILSSLHELPPGMDRQGVARFSTRAVHLDEHGTPAPAAGWASASSPKALGSKPRSMSHAP